MDDGDVMIKRVGVPLIVKGCKGRSLCNLSALVDGEVMVTKCNVKELAFVDAMSCCQNVLAIDDRA